jgi:MFS family permease
LPAAADISSIACRDLSEWQAPTGVAPVNGVPDGDDFGQAGSQEVEVRVYLLSAGFARLADEMVALAVVLFVLARTGDPVLSGAVVAAYTLPSIVSGPLLGAWLDRTGRPVVALAGNQFALAAAAAGLVWTVGHAPVAVVLGLAFLAGTTLPLTSGGFTSLLPRLARDLPRATHADALLFNITALGGPALAGVLAGSFEAHTAVLAISGLALAGGVCTVALRVPPHPAQKHPLSVRDGVRHMVTTAPLRGATVATVLSHGSVGLLATALPEHVDGLGLPRGAAGFLWAAIEIGCIIGLLALRRHLHRWRPERTVYATVAAYGAALATWPLAPGFPALLALALLTGIAQGPTLTSVIRARQRYTPSMLLGQVSTTGASLKIGAFAIGAAAGGVLVARTTTDAVILVVAAAQFAAAGLGASAGRAAPKATPVGRP